MTSPVQPFAHVGAPNAVLYGQVMRTFARAKERFIVHLRPEDVASDLRRDSDEQLVQALDQLTEWGNLRADPTPAASRPSRTFIGSGSSTS
jgi:uncharacterized protein DUF2397